MKDISATAAASSAFYRKSRLSNDKLQEREQKTTPIVMHILVLGDSLPLPRPNKGQPLRCTWPALLKARLPQSEIWSRAHTRFTITDVLKELGFFTESLTDFQALIIQTGIVDCAPRPYPHLVSKLIDVSVSMPTFRKIERFSHQRLLWLYRRPWVSERAFGKSIEQLVRTAHQHNPQLVVLFVPIAQPNRAIAKLLTGIDVAANRYNTILKKETTALSSEFGCQCIDPFTGSDPLEITIDDGHHLSETGHALVADALARALQPQFATNTSIVDGPVY